MATQETYLTSFIEGMQVTAERFIQIAQFDKTVSAKIVDKDKNNDNLYYVSTTGCSRLAVHASADDNTIYALNDNVYVNIPDGDFSSPNKLIIGRVSSIDYKSQVKTTESYLLDGYTLFNSSVVVSNKERYPMLIVEFTPVFLGDIPEEAIGVKEIVFPYTLKGSTLKGKEILIKGLWSTKDLYGSIFGTVVKNKQYLFFSGLENYYNFSFSWDIDINQPITLLGFQGKEITGNCFINLGIADCFYTYTAITFDNNSIYNTSVILTEDGVKFFRKENGVWGEKTILSGDYNVSSLNTEDAGQPYEWNAEWYERDYTQETPVASYIPAYWKKLENAPEKGDYKNKMFCLIATDKDAQYYNSYNRKVLYSILE